MNKSHIFDPELLEIFLALADTRSFTEAARVVERSQSNVSTSVRRLEDAAGLQLVSRTTHSVALTSAGEDMADYARQVCALSEQAMRRFAQPGVSGCIRLGVFSSFNSLALGEALRRFRAEHPTLQVCVETNRSDILLSRFRDGSLDVVLATRLPGHGLGTPVWRDDFIWMAAPGVITDSRDPVPLVARVRPSMVRRVGIEALNAARRRHLVVFEANSLTSVAAACCAGLGAAVFTRSIRPAGADIVEPPLLPSLGLMDVVLLMAEDEGGAAGFRSLHGILTEMAEALFTGASHAMFGAPLN